MKQENPGVSEDIARSLGRVEGKLDALALQLIDHIKKDEMAWAKVSSLEKKMIWFSGLFAAVMFFATSTIRKVFGI